MVFMVMLLFLWFYGLCYFLFGFWVVADLMPNSLTALGHVVGSKPLVKMSAAWRSVLMY